MSRFQGRHVVITGGSGGIGKATAARVVAEGGRVLITGTNQGKLDQARREIDGLIALVNDAGDPESAPALAAAVETHLGRVDGLFLNAGYGEMVSHDQVTAAQFDRQFAVNVRGPILQVRALAGLLTEGAAIVLNTSVVQEIGMPGGILYGASKAVLRNVTRVLAAEMAPKVRVNAVSPGPVSTDFFARTGLPEEQTAALAQGILSQVALQRFGQPGEIASAAAFLLSADASFMTGSELVVDGGITQV